MKSIKRFLMLIPLLALSFVALFACSIDISDKNVTIEMDDLLHVGEVYELNTNLSLEESAKVEWSLEGAEGIVVIEGDYIRLLAAGEFDLIAQYGSLRNVKHFKVVEWQTLTIEYELNGGQPGSKPLVESYRENDAAILLENPVREGYVFAGFYKDAEFAGEKVFSVYGPDCENLKLYAKWVEIEYAVYFNLAGGALEAELPSAVKYFETLDLTQFAPEKEHFTFAGWFLGAEKVEEVSGADLGGAATFVAHYDAVEYPIAFELNGGAAELPSSRTALDNITLPEATKEMYVFAGWFDNEELEGDAVTNLDASNLELTKLYAKWEVAIYQLTVDLAGGSLETPIEIEYTVSTQFELPTPAKEHYDFAGWLLNGEAVTSFDGAVAKANATLTATYTANAYAIEFVLDGGSAENLPASRTVEDTLTLPAAVKAGYIFAGWFVDAEFSGDAVTELNAENISLEQLFAKFNLGAAYIGETPYLSLQAALDAAQDGDTIRVAAVTIEAAVTINKAITLEGPNKGVKGYAERAEEATFKGTITITAEGVTIDGIRCEEDAYILVNANNATIKNIYTISKTSKVGTSNRYAQIVAGTVNGLEILDSYMNAGSNGNQKGCIGAEAVVRNVLIKGNHLFNDVTSTSAICEAIELYNIGGTIEIIENEIRFNTDNFIVYMGNYSNVATKVVIKDNIFAGSEAAENKHTAGVSVRYLPNGSEYVFEHNQVYNMYGNTIDTRYAVAGSSASYLYNTFELPFKYTNKANATLSFEGNLYLSAQTTATPDYDAEYNEEALDAAYNLYLHAFAVVNGQKYLKLKEAYEAAQDGDVIELLATEDAIVDELNDATLIDFVISKSVKFVGLGRDVTIVRVQKDMINLDAAEISFEKLALVGPSAGYAAGKMFQTTSKAEKISFKDCTLMNVNTFLKVDNGNNVEVEVLDSHIEGISQFFLWFTANVAKVDFIGNDVDGASCGATPNAAATFIRVRSKNTVVNVYNNTFTGTHQNDNDGYFENGADGVVFNVMFNTFADCQKVVHNNGGRLITFNKNLYLDAQGNALDATPAAVLKAGVVGDAKLAKSEEERAQFYANFLAGVIDELHQIAYELNGGVLPEGAPVEFMEGETVALLDPTKEGFEFAGWFLTSDFAGVALTQIPLDAKEDLVLYAKWNEIAVVAEYNLTFDLDGGAFAPAGVDLVNSTVKHTINITDYIAYQSVSGAEVSLMKKGETTIPRWWAFVALQPAEDGLYEIVKLANGSTALPEEYEYAIGWHSGLTDTEMKTLLNSMLNNGAAYVGMKVLLLDVPAERTTDCEITAIVFSEVVMKSSAPEKYVSGQETELPVPTKEGFEFNGWLLNGQLITNIDATMSGDLVLVASWEAPTVKHEISYVLNEGQLPEGAPLEFVEGEGVQLVDATRQGYIFKGWFTSEAFEGEALTEISASEAADVTLYAKWEEAPQVQYPVMIGTQGYMTLEDAYAASKNGDVIELKDGTYETSIIFSKSVTLKGESKLGTIIKPSLDTTNLAAKEIKFINLTLSGKSDGAVSGVLFQTTAALEHLAFEGCKLMNINTFLKMQNGTNALVEVKDCEVRGIAQFFMWITKGLNKLTVTGTHFDLESCGAVFNEAASLLRIRSANAVVEIYDNVFDGSVNTNIDGLFENGADGITYLVKFNTFKNTQAFVHNNGNRVITFDKNLYLDASGNALDATPSAVLKPGVVGDVTLANSEQERAQFYYDFLHDAVYTISYNLDGGVFDGTPGVVSFQKLEEINLGVAKKEGYRFIGWYENDQKVTEFELRNYELVAKYVEEGLYVGTAEYADYATIAEALAAAQDGQTIIVLDGEYDEALTISKKVTLKGLAHEDVKENAAVLKGKVTVASDDVTLAHLAFTGTARVMCTNYDNFTFNYNYVHDIANFKASWSETRDYGFGFLNVTASNDNQAKNYKVQFNEFNNVDDTMIEFGCIDGVLVEGNKFTNFRYEAIRFEGGYNDGEIIVINNLIANDANGGYAGIYMRSYGGHENREVPLMYFAGNTFMNLGYNATVAGYAAAIACRNFQEFGANFIISDNDFINCKNYIKVRNNYDYPSRFNEFKEIIVVENNNFIGVPSDFYYSQNTTSSDTKAACPFAGYILKNFYADAEGNKVELDLAKMISTVVVEAQAEERIQHQAVNATAQVKVRVVVSEEQVLEMYAPYKETLELPQVELANSIFRGFYLTQNFQGEAIEKLEGAEWLTYVYAKFDAYVVKTIAYELNGGTLPEGAPTSYVVELGATLPTPTKEGNVFLGWYDNAECKGSAITEISKQASEDVMLYALWQDLSAKYNVTYNLNGGNFIYESYEAVAEDLLKDLNAITNNGITKDNFTSKCRNVQFAAFLADDAMWAKWAWLFRYMKEIDKNENSHNIYDEVLESRTCGSDYWWFLTRDFAGFVNKGIANFYYSVAPIDFTSYEIAEGIWELIQPQFQAQDVQTLATPYRPYYTFAGWYENEDLSGEPMKVLYKDCTLYAKWELATVDLTYVLNNEEANLEKEVVKVHASDAFDLATPDFNAKYWKFEGWFSDEALTQPITKIENYTTAPVTAYAKWTEISGYTIVYHLNGGSIKYPTRADVIADFITDYDAAMGKTYKTDGSDMPTGAWSDIDFHTFFTKTLDGGITVRSKWLWLAQCLYDLSKAQLASNNCNVLGLKKLVENEGQGYSGDDIYGVSYAFRAFLASSVVRPGTSYKSVDYSDYNNAHAYMPYLSAAENSEYLNNKGDVVLPQCYLENYRFVGWFDNEQLAGDPITVQPESDVTVHLYAKFEEANPVTSVVIENKVDSIALYETLQLQVTVNPAEALIRTVSYTSSNPAVASISNDGLITTYATGEVTFTIKSQSAAGCTDSFTMVVYAPAHFTVSYETESYVEVGGQIQLNAKYVLEDHSEKPVVFSSLNENIASVQDNVVTGLAVGTAKIRAALADNADIYFDFEVTVLDSNLSELLQFVVDNHNSNVYVRYDFGVGAGTPAYYMDLVGNISDITYNMPYEVNTKYVEQQAGISSNHGGKMTSVEFITVHYTGNMDAGATAAANASYFSSGGGGTSIHYVVGNDGIFASLDESYVGYHAGDGTAVKFEWHPTGVMVADTDPATPAWGASSDSYFTLNGKKTSIQIPEGDTNATKHITDSRYFNKMGFAWKVVNGEYYMGTTWWCYSQVSEGRVCNKGGNLNSIGIESAVNRGSDLFYTWQKLSQLVADIAIRHNLGDERVVGHHFFSAKDCPQPFLANGLELWDTFMDMYRASRKVQDAYKDYEFVMEPTSLDNLDVLGETGRVTQPNFARLLTYKVMIINKNNPNDIQEITLSSVVNGRYSK